MNHHKLMKLRAQLDKHKYQCKSWCFECCTRTPALDQEVKIMVKELRKNGYTEPPRGKGPKYCEMLTTEGKCSVYSQRPIICRSFADIGYKIKTKDKEFITPSCTYWDTKIVMATHEFTQYGRELLDKGCVIGNVEDIL